MKALLLAGILIGMGGVSTSAVTAKIGDAAAPLSVKRWIKGEPVTVGDGKAIYVIEFWATWCGPCVDQIPHLTELQARYREKGVVVIGITDEPEEVAKPFIEKQGKKMEYRVACDDERKTNKGYMEAYEAYGIPHSFIVGRDGKVLWNGHPVYLAEALQAVVEGNYDLNGAIRREALRELRGEYRTLARKNDPAAKEMGRKALAQSFSSVEDLTALAWTILSDEKDEAPDLALAAEALNRAETLSNKADMGLLNTQAELLFRSGKIQEAIAKAEEALSLCPAERKAYMHERIQKMAAKLNETHAKIR